MKPLNRLLCVIAATAIGVLFALGGSSAPRAAAADGCITALPLSWSVSSHYAAAWTKRLQVSVHTNGPEIYNLNVTLSTFGGDILGKAALSRPLTSNGRLSIKLRFPMQPGAYTLYFMGEPNPDPSCGPKHDSSTIRLSGCQTPLPIKIVKPPQGYADSYQGRYSFYVSDPTGVLLEGLSASLSTFEGQVAGTVKIPVLFGKLHVSIPLRRALEPAPERYTVDISGYPPGRPRSCGAGQASRTVTFH